jgi:hypothetical protein
VGARAGPLQERTTLTTKDADALRAELAPFLTGDPAFAGGVGLGTDHPKIRSNPHPTSASRSATRLTAASAVRPSAPAGGCPCCRRAARCRRRTTAAKARRAAGSIGRRAAHA